MRNAGPAGTAMSTLVRHPDLTAAFLPYSTYVLAGSTLPERGETDADDTSAASPPDACSFTVLSKRKQRYCHERPEEHGRVPRGAVGAREHGAPHPARGA